MMAEVTNTRNKVKEEFQAKAVYIAILPVPANTLPYQFDVHFY